MGGAAYLSGDPSNPVAINLSDLSYAYVLMEVNVRYVKLLSHLTDLPNHTATEEPLPEDVVRDYLREPHPKVVELVLPEFRKWLSNTTGSEVGDLSSFSKAWLAVKAAEFTYGYYITYSPSLIPREFEEVLESRRGDCDDMSRVLINLLWALGIPARIDYGYVYLDWEGGGRIGNSYMFFEDAGPHAWVSAYVPSLGWVSLDFLAGANIVHPALVTGFTSEGYISREDIEEMVEFQERNRYVEYVKVGPLSNLSGGGLVELITEGNERLEVYLRSLAEELNVSSSTIDELIHGVFTSLSTPSITQVLEGGTPTSTGMETNVSTEVNITGVKGEIRWVRVITLILLAVLLSLTLVKIYKMRESLASGT